jgi:hypothetical protein
MGARRLVAACGMLIVASGCGSGAAVAGNPAAVSNTPSSSKVAPTTTTTTTTTTVVPPPVTTTTTPVPPQCRYVSLDAMARATNVSAWTLQKDNPPDECWYLASGLGVVNSIELVIDPPGRIGRPAGSTSVPGLGGTAYWDPKLRGLVVHPPKHDFAVFLTQAPMLAADPDAALGIARNIVNAAKPALG